MADTAAEALVREFCDAWSRRDVDELLGWFHPDAVYHNMPLPPAEGLDAIRGVLAMFVPMADEIVFEIHHVASTDAVVFTERTDHFTTGGVTTSLPVTGVFELRYGRIAAWRDYFDLQSFLGQSG
jgi:limonene-1,2-epoxide hydrolase